MLILFRGSAGGGCTQQVTRPAGGRSATSPLIAWAGRWCAVTGPGLEGVDQPLGEQAEGYEDHGSACDVCGGAGEAGAGAEDLLGGVPRGR